MSRHELDDWELGNDFLQKKRRLLCPSERAFWTIQPDDQLALKATSLGLSGRCVKFYKLSNLGMLESVFFYRRKFQSDTSACTSYSCLWNSAELSTKLSTKRCYIDDIAT